MSFSTVCTPTVLPSAMAIFSACSVVPVAPDTFTLSPSTSILTPDASRPCLSSSFLSSSAGAALASLPPKIDAPTFLTNVINPMKCPPIAGPRSERDFAPANTYTPCAGCATTGARPGQTAFELERTQALFILFMIRPTIAVTIAPDTPPPTSWPTQAPISMPFAPPASIGMSEVKSDPPAMPPTAPATVLPPVPRLTLFAADRAGDQLNDEVDDRG